MLEAVEAVNDDQKHVLTNKVLARFGARPRAGAPSRCGDWPSSRTPTTCAKRRAASCIDVLLRAGASVVAHDPIAVEETQRVLKLDFADAPALLDSISFVAAKDPMEALDGADALIIVTEWKAYRSPNLERLKALMKSPVIFDGRNLYEPSTMKEAGIVYQGIGRNSPEPSGVALNPNRTGPYLLAYPSMAHNPFMSAPSPDAELIALIDRVGHRDEAALRLLYERASPQACSAWRCAWCANANGPRTCCRKTFLTIWRVAGDYREFAQPADGVDGPHRAQPVARPAAPAHG